MAEWVKVGEISRYAQANAPMTNSLEQLAAECCPEWAETPAERRRIDYSIEAKTFSLFVWKEVPDLNGRERPMADFLFVGEIAEEDLGCLTAAQWAANNIPGWADAPLERQRIWFAVFNTSGGKGYQFFLKEPLARESAALVAEYAKLLDERDRFEPDATAERMFRRHGPEWVRAAIEVLKTKKENQTMTPYDFKIIRRTKESEQIINTGHVLAKSNEDAKVRVVAEVDDFEPDTDEVIVRPFCG